MEYIEQTRNELRAKLDRAKKEFESTAIMSKIAFLIAGIDGSDFEQTRTKTYEFAFKMKEYVIANLEKEPPKSALMISQVMMGLIDGLTALEGVMLIQLRQRKINPDTLETYKRMQKELFALKLDYDNG